MRKLISVLAVVALSVGLVLSSVAFGATKKVGVKGLTFSPKTITVKKGTTVKWSWKGSVPHNVVGKGFKSGNPKAAVTYSHKFTKKGTYKYVCSIHKAAGMTGTIKVK